VSGIEALEEIHTVAVVIPVYRGELTLTAVVTELLPYTELRRTVDGHPYRVEEIVLVHDVGGDRSDDVIRKLERTHEPVRAVWMSRNYGQHPATLAGMTSTGSDWILTLDEDGQYDPAFLPAMLDVAMRTQRPLVYGQPTNPPPHGTLRNAGSRSAKWIFTRLLAEEDASRFSSFRLVLGEYGRSVAAYCGPGIYLDVALAWIVGRAAACPVVVRAESDRPSGYSTRRLLSHFWRLVITSGTRPLRLASAIGLIMAMTGFVLAVVLAVGRLLEVITVDGWTSVIVVLLVGTGTILITLGVIAEYVGVAATTAMGRPLYLVTSDPASSPLGRTGRGE
jgi:polyisoprenyl-phosphate glycosyltransferase